MAIELAPTLVSLNPFRAAVSVLVYLGRMAMLTTSALRASVRPVGPAPPMLGETVGQVHRLLGQSLALVALVHVGMGSFLSMQAYFGAIFTDGIGPVVGVGLIRNLSPLLTGFLMAGVVAARVVPELRGWSPGGSDELPGEAARLVAARLAAAMIAGPVLAAWGSFVGILIGWQVAHSMMGLTVPAFFDMFLEMLWARDVLGLVVKGAGFGFVAALFACHEGLSRPVEAGNSAEVVCSAAGRAATLSCLAILFFNAAWFLLVYHAGPAFGPTVLSPPSG